MKNDYSDSDLAWFRKALVLSVMMAGCAVAIDPVGSVVDHTAQYTATQQEGCQEVEADSPSLLETQAGVCHADDGFHCDFSVILSDGTHGCCSENQDTTTTTVTGTWHGCSL
jgi:hypothetical protein